jgi:hypothetical protein
MFFLACPVPSAAKFGKDDLAMFDDLRLKTAKLRGPDAMLSLRGGGEPDYSVIQSWENQK